MIEQVIAVVVGLVAYDILKKIKAKLYSKKKPATVKKKKK